MVCLYLCWLVFRPFVAVITWAVVLAVVARPWYCRLERRFRRNAAALLTVISVSIVLVGPAVLVVHELYIEASAGLQALGPQLTSENVHSKLERYPWVGKALERLETSLQQEVHGAAGALAAKASRMVGSSVWGLTQLFFTILTLFYFLRDGPWMLGLLRRLIPLSEQQTADLLERVSQTIRACLYGNAIVKAVQGILGGLMFWMLGLPAPVLCGAAMALCAVLPVVGTALVWGPAAIYLVLAGSWVKAVILAAWGAFVVGLIDNVLYPILVAGEVRLHALAVFFSVLGGLIAFGFSGVILGPIILVLTGFLLEIWQVRQRHDSRALEQLEFERVAGSKARESL